MSEADYDVLFSAYETTNEIVRELTCAGYSARKIAREDSEPIHDKAYDHYFGMCPVCKQDPNRMIFGTQECPKTNTMVCDACKTFWVVGSNLFSGWRWCTDEDFADNWKVYYGGEYLEVEEYYPPGHCVHQPVFSQAGDDNSVPF